MAKIVLLLAVLCITLCSASTCTNFTSPVKSIPTSLQRMDITFPTSPINFVVEYYTTTSGNMEASMSGCEEDIEGFIMSLVQSNSSITVALTTAVQSPASRPLATNSITLMIMAITSLFLFPKNRLSILVVLALVCLLSVAPTTLAASESETIVIRIGIPENQNFTICINGDCFSYPITSSGSTTTVGSTAGSTTGSTTGSSIPSSGSSTASTTGVSPTNAPTTPVTSTTGAHVKPTPTLPPAAYSFNIRVLILAGYAQCSYKDGNDGKKCPIPNISGGDFAVLAFNTVGTPTNFVVVNSSVDLSSYLSTSGVGQYSAIITIGNQLLSSAQISLVKAYQTAYGVGWAVIGSDGTNLPGITVGTQVQQAANIKLNSAFADVGPTINPLISVLSTDGTAFSGAATAIPTFYPVTVTDSSVVTPAIDAEWSGNTAVVAAAFNLPDGTQQFHYFIQNTAAYIHSMAFHVLLVNWLSPAGLFIGARRLSLTVQPDDLFLGSYIWNTTTHTNPVASTDPFYRITADDLQNLADFFDNLNSNLPDGSYLTVEWPTNFGGINNSYYTQGEFDYLWQKSTEIQDKFYYLSHTWDHPCTFDTNLGNASYELMYSELSQNKEYLPNFFEGGQNNHLWSKNSMINPCVTGLYNGDALRAMWANNITGCVSDESVSKGDVDYEPITPYHGVYSTMAVNGFDGMFFVPREALDIDYCDEDIVEFYDEFLTPEEDGSYNLGPNSTLAEAIALQTMYGVQDKVAFRHDPFMMHQTNAKSFIYNDPVKGERSVSLVSLWIEWVVEQTMAYYTMPINIIQMDDLVQLFKDRTQMDQSNVVATVSVDANGNAFAVTITSSEDCVIPISGVMLSGTTVTKTEAVGTETSTYIQSTAGVSQTFAFPAPIQV